MGRVSGSGLFQTANTAPHFKVVQIGSVRVRIVWANVSVGSDLCEVNRTDRYRVAIDTARYLLEAVAAAAADAADAFAHCSRRAHRS